MNMRKILGATLAFGPMFGFVYAIGGWEAIGAILGVIVFLWFIVIGVALMSES